MTQRFSVRTGAGKPEYGLVLEDIPEGVADGLCNLMQRMPELMRLKMRRAVCDSMDIFYRSGAEYAWTHPHYWNFRNFVRTEVLPGGWYRFYDLVEILWELLEDDYRDSYGNEVNAILRRNFIGYELRDGRVERVGASPADATIAEARGILRDARFQGPNDQFLKAIGFHSQRPAPDVENCVKEAVGAVEGMARILLRNDSMLLSDAAKELVKRGKIPTTLRKAFDGIYAYRGDAEGVGHGRTGEPEVRVEDAEFVLNSSAALIVYLARLYGVEVET